MRLDYLFGYCETYSCDRIILHNASDSKDTELCLDLTSWNGVLSMFVLQNVVSEHSKCDFIVVDNTLVIVDNNYHYNLCDIIERNKNHFELNDNLNDYETIDGYEYDLWNDISVSINDRDEKYCRDLSHLLALVQ